MNQNVLKITKISIVLIRESISNAERNVGYETPNINFTSFRL